MQRRSVVCSEMVCTSNVHVSVHVIQYNKFDSVRTDPGGNCTCFMRSMSYAWAYDSRSAPETHATFELNFRQAGMLNVDANSSLLNRKQWVHKLHNPPKTMSRIQSDYSDIIAIRHVRSVTRLPYVIRPHMCTHIHTRFDSTHIFRNPRI